MKSAKLAKRYVVNPEEVAEATDEIEEIGLEIDPVGMLKAMEKSWKKNDLSEKDGDIVEALGGTGSALRKGICGKDRLDLSSDYKFMQGLFACKDKLLCPFSF